MGMEKYTRHKKAKKVVARSGKLVKVANKEVVMTKEEAAEQIPTEQRRGTLTTAKQVRKARKAR